MDGPVTWSNNYLATQSARYFRYWEKFSAVQVMAPPLKGLLTPHILNICLCLIHYLSQLQF